MKKINRLITAACVMSLCLAPSLSLFANESKSTSTGEKDCCATESSANTEEHHHDGDEDHEHHDGDKEHEHHHDGDEEHDHDHEDEHKPADPRYEGDVAYWGVFDLKKGTNQIQTGHTHEKRVKLIVLPIDEDSPSEEMLANAKTMMKLDGEKVEDQATVKLTTDKPYELSLAHMSGALNLDIEKDGKYIVFTNIAPGDTLPMWLVDEEENELTAVKEEVLDDSKSQIYHGYFKDDMVKDRELKEWNGDWKSVYPLLEDGSLDEVMEAKAKTGKMTAEEYKKYYDVGYKTDVDSIVIKDNTMTFKIGDKEVSAEYKYDGYKILTYEKGNRGVRFLFSAVNPVEGAPKFVQFSDHNIAPSEPQHFHIYMGDTSQDDLLKEMEHWPTYYPSSFSVEEIKADMLAH